MLTRKVDGLWQRTYRLVLVIETLIFNDLVDDVVKEESHVEQIESEKETSQYVLPLILHFLHFIFINLSKASAYELFST